MAPSKLPGPGFRDWALFAVSIVFVAIGAWALFDKPDKALMPLTFFGVCAIAAGVTLYRKYRRQRFTATSVAVPGGVKLRGSNSRMLLLAAGIFIPGITIFFVPSPLIIQVCGAVMVGASAWLLFAITTGRISGRFLRFDRPGLTIGEPTHEYFIPWDAIVEVAEFEMFDNASVGFNVPSPDAVIVTPPDKRERVLKGLANNAGMTGFHVVLMAGHFGVPAESLCAAIRNYAQNPNAREDLVPKPTLTASS